LSRGYFNDVSHLIDARRGDTLRPRKIDALRKPRKVLLRNCRMIGYLLKKGPVVQFFFQPALQARYFKLFHQSIMKLRFQAYLGRAFLAYSGNDLHAEAT